jgi:arsenite methyltransferase
MKANKIRKAVRKTYAAVAKQGSSCCGPAEPCECGTGELQTSSQAMGYSAKELKSAPKGANMGLGCGNPVAIASLKAGDTVVDLGSGGGFDCFLAAQRVGKKGRVIGVDMTPEMIEKARENAMKIKYNNVEFRLGEIEHLPVADQSADVVISNCVINLAPDKRAVLKEVYRVLKRGGRIAVSDLALVKKLPPKLRNSIDAYTSCIGGAILLDEYKRAVKAAGFKNIKIAVNDRAVKEAAADYKGFTTADRKKLTMVRFLAEHVVSAYIQAVK